MFRAASVNSVKRFYSATASKLATPAPTNAATAMVLNFCTPHAPVYNNKVVERVTLPGEKGEFGVTMGHSPIISQLKPGVVTINHTNGETERFFISGGFSMTNANSVTDLSVSEAYPLSEFDENAVRNGHSEAVKASTSTDEKVKAVAQIEVAVFQALSKAMGITL